MFFLSLGSIGQELPPIVNYPTEVYGAGNQNWMLSQSEERFIYAANNNGLLEFNGAAWKLYRTPNESITRSVNAIGNRIYTGFYMGFGYWERNLTGILEFTSLSDNLPIKPIENEEFWNIFPYQKWVLFQSLNRIIILNPETLEINIIESDALITKMFQLNNELFFQVLGQGVFTIKNGDKKRINDSDIAKNTRFIGICSLNEKVAFITENKGVYQLQDQELNQWNSKTNDYISKLTVYSALQKRNGDILLGTISNGIIHIDLSGKILYNITQTSGLKNNTILSIFEDADSNIWMGLDNGIDCINSASPIKTLTEQGGSLGTTYTSSVFEGQIYLGTNQGLFYKSIIGNEPFKLVPNTEGQVWSLKVLDGTLFCGHNLGTFIIKNNLAYQISDIMGTWDLKSIPDRPDMLLQGNYDGLYLLAKTNGIWSYQQKIKGFDISAKHFELTNNRKVFVSHEYKGVFEVQLSDEYTEVINYKKLTSLNRGVHAGLEQFGDEIYYTNSEGVFKRNKKDDEFIKVNELSQLIDHDGYSTGNMIIDEYDRLWLFTKSNLFAVSKNNIDESYTIKKISLPHSLRNEMEGYENITFLSKDKFIYGNSRGYLLLDLERFVDKTYRIYITNVSASDNKGHIKELPIDDGGQLDFNYNNFEFQFSIPVFDKYLATSYQYRITPFDKTWSSWTTNSAHSIKNLPPGSYTFELKAKVNDQILADPVYYEFVIDKPYYLSNAAFTLYSILFFTILFLVNSAYKRHYKKQREKILKQKTKDLELREMAAQKEIIELKNEKLSHEIEARNRELAISTMNMVSKTSTLNSLKEQLIHYNDDNKLKPVINNINKIINDKNDWKFFEKAFNHADKKFFKKLKEKHPELTPNDLRLCVYLRLNLSSKEIAPLLNISHRSVEIKRYRLRKKLDLERDTNLNDYFINM